MAEKCRMDRAKEIVEEMDKLIDGDHVLLMEVLSVFARKHKINKMSLKMSKNGNVKLETTTWPDK